MDLKQFGNDEQYVARRYRYDDAQVVAVDFGDAGPDAAVDVVDDTVIVVLEDGQREFELPAGTNDAQAFIKNGVLTVELEVDE